MSAVASGHERQPLLELNDIAVSFGGLVALDGVSLHADEEEIVSLIGPNGAGKTTLFNVISGILTPSRGRIRLAGQDIAKLDVVARARLGMARTFQRMELFEQLNARDNMLVARELRRSTRAELFGGALSGNRPATQDDVAVVDSLAEGLGIASYADVPVERLSTAARRLVELGRVLAVEPRLVLLDEPTSGLDTATTTRFVELIRRWRTSVPSPPTVLLVEHDMRVALEIADRVYVLDFGKLIAKGTPVEVRENPSVRTAYLGKTA